MGKLRSFSNSNATSTLRAARTNGRACSPALKSYYHSYQYQYHWHSSPVAPTAADANRSLSSSRRTVATATATGTTATGVMQQRKQLQQQQVCGREEVGEGEGVRESSAAEDGDYDSTPAPGPVSTTPPPPPTPPCPSSGSSSSRPLLREEGGSEMETTEKMAASSCSGSGGEQDSSSCHCSADVMLSSEAPPAQPCTKSTLNTDSRQIWQVGHESNQSLSSSPGQETSSECCPEERPMGRRVVALDCEMVGVKMIDRIMGAVGQCSVVSYTGEVLFNEYVKPDLPIAEYRTHISGIRPKNMKRAIPFREAVARVKELLHGCIVVGHDLNNDFIALGYHHDPYLTRDTAKFNPLRELAGMQRNNSPSLKALSKILLGKEIQKGQHSSLVDAQVAMQIYRKVEAAWEHNLQDHRDRGEGERSFWFHDQFWPDDI